MKNTRFLLLGMLLCVACNQEQKTKTPIKKASFQETLEIHLNAVSNRNLEALEPTVAEDVSLIFPQGEKLDSKKEFMEFHETWFQHDNWEWKGEVLKAESTDSLGYGLVQYTYTEKDSVGNAVYSSNAYLLLVFRNSAEAWQLVHDQNTKIQKADKNE